MLQGRPRHIRGLDGVRALAIAAVLVFHLSPASLPGGFIGVDVFFVVSGFLITTLLIRELDAKGKINLPRFWLRRARRLLPALALVVLVSVSGGLLLGDDLLVGIGRQTFGALTFSTNWVEILAGSSYFASTSPQLFAHFWSLAVEEQFYLLWPVLFAVVMALAPTWRARIAVALSGAVISAALMAALVVPGQDATRVYYGTDTHAFGLLLGVALAFLWSGTRALDHPVWVRFSPLTAAAALAGVVLLMLQLDENTVITFRGGLFLATLLTAVLIAAVLPARRSVLWVAEARPLAWLGERSYGIYLWHWPVLLLLTAAFPAAAIDSALHWVVRGLALAVTLLVSAWSYRALETPIRKNGFRAFFATARAALAAPVLLPKLAAGGVVVLVALTGVGLATAPEKSAAQAAIEAGQDIVDASAKAASAAPASAGRAEATAPEEATAPSARAPVTDTAADFSVPTGEEITAIGDSLIVTSADGLRYYLPGINFEAKSNRQWKDAAGVIQSALDAGTVRRAVILDFGTNAGLEDPDVLRRALDLLGPERMIVLVNLYSPSTFIDSTNALFEEVAAEYPNVIVADWNSAVRDHPEMLQSDRTHPSIDGMHLFTQTVIAAFEELAAQHAN